MMINSLKIQPFNLTPIYTNTINDIINNKFNSDNKYDGFIKQCIDFNLQKIFNNFNLKKKYYHQN